MPTILEVKCAIQSEIEFIYVQDFCSFFLRLRKVSELRGRYIECALI